MEVNEQTLYDDELLNILPDGVIILDINGKILQNFMFIHLSIQ